MKLQLEWMRPIPLKIPPRQSFIYQIDLHKLPEAAGIYVLGRRFGKGFEALYVGKATNIRRRVKRQLNNARLQVHLKTSKTGARVALMGRFLPKPGQRSEKCLALIERALIRYFLSEGHNLVNKQGTLISRHDIMSIGKLPKRLIPPLMYLEKSKGE